MGSFSRPDLKYNLLCDVTQMRITLLLLIVFTTGIFIPFELPTKPIEKTWQRPIECLINSLFINN